MEETDWSNYFKRLQEKSDELLLAIKKNLPELEEKLAALNGHWGVEDTVYRFYHQSFKVYAIQSQTAEVVTLFKRLAPPGTGLCREFVEIMEEGASGKAFSMEHNQAWTQHTRPFLEAMFHAKYFLEMMIRYGKELDASPQLLPSGWAAVLSLYGLR
jgi:hypothetical protein